MHALFHYPRLCLRIAACVFQFIALCISIAVNSYTGFAYTGVIEVPILGIALIWNTSEFVTIIVNKKGIKLGWQIALDFMLWGALFGSGVSGSVTWSNPSSFCFGACPKVTASNSSLGNGAEALEIIAALAHFSLFILDCIALRKSRQSRTLQSEGDQLGRLEAEDYAGRKNMTSQRESILKPELPGKLMSAAVEKTELPGQGAVVSSESITAELPDQSTWVPLAKPIAEMPAGSIVYQHIRRFSGQDLNYRVLGKVGAGSFGSVYKVRRNSDGEILACKEIKTSRHPQLVEYAEREITALAALREHSDHVLEIRDAAVDPTTNTVRIYTDYCYGGDLQRIVDMTREAGGYLPEVTISMLIWSIAISLLHCHTTGMIHRDLKPANVLLKRPWRGGSQQDDGNIRLGDFGIVKFVRYRYTVGTFAGTPGYMAPEISETFAEYSFESDWFAFGCLVYTLCELRPPSSNRNIPLISSRYSSELRQFVKALVSEHRNNRPDREQIMETITSIAERANKTYETQSELIGNSMVFNAPINVVEACRDVMGPQYKAALQNWSWEYENDRLYLFDLTKMGSNIIKMANGRAPDLMRDIEELRRRMLSTQESS